MNIRERIIKSIQDNRELVFAAEKYLVAHAATGYREYESSEYLAARFSDLGYKVKTAGNIPGFIAELESASEGPLLCILAELDSLLVPEHPDAVAESGAAHACGHHTGCAAILAVAAALKEKDVLAELSGSIRFAVVPAEELIEIEFRDGLRKAGAISYFSGKIEFLHRGLLDGVELAFMVHSSSNCPGGFAINRGNNGCITKSLTYSGKSSHAGSAPHLGINALYAAEVGIAAVNALRETFKEKDYIRVHPIITNGGTVVNAIPSVVKLESFVRAADTAAMQKENKKINRAFAAGAVALGAQLNINDRFGYMPLKNDDTMAEIAAQCMAEVVGTENVNTDGAWSTGSTDMGDLSSIIPILHPYVGGAEGTPHGADYLITDGELAIVKNAIFQALFAYSLMKDNATEAKRVLKNKKVVFNNKEEYFQLIKSFSLQKDVVSYHDSGKIIVDLEGDD